MRTLEWRSLGGAEYRLEIQDGMDEVRGLVGGASPFVTSTDDDDDFFAAVRTTTGAICVIGDVAEVEELVTGVPADKLVELYAKKSDGTDLGCVWRGFLQTTAYSQAWNKGPLQFSLPVVSPLGVLDSFYPKADVVAETWSFAEFLVNANKAKEGMQFWDGFVFPASCNPEQTLMYRMQMQNFGTYDEKQERWHVESYMVILQEVCKLFGWACQEWNNKLVFLAADDTTEYLGYRADRLEQKIETGVAIVENIRVETTAETIWGAEHQLDYIDGKKSVEVTGEVNAFDESLFSMNFDNLKIGSLQSKNIVSGGHSKNYFSKNYLNPANIETLLENANVMYENGYNGADICGGSFVSTRYVDYDTDTYVDIDDTGWIDQLIYRYGGDDENLIVRIKVKNKFSGCRLFKGKYLLLNFDLLVADSATSDFYTLSVMYVNIGVNIGGKIIASGRAAVFDGKVIHLGVPSIGLTSDENGWIVKIPDDTPSGDIYVTISHYYDMDYSAKYQSFRNITLSYLSDWREDFGESETENSFKHEGENGFTSYYNVSSKLTAYKEHEFGAGIILASDPSAEPPVSLNVSGERPEVHLADRLWRYYKQSRKKLTVQLRMDGEGLNPLNLHSFSTAVPLSTEIRGMACLAQTIDWAEDMVTASLFEIKN